MYKIIFHKNAARFYENSDANLRRRINKAIENISQNPYYGIHIKKLHGELSSMYSYRMGDIRIKTIEARGDAYKRK